PEPQHPATVRSSDQVAARPHHGARVSRQKPPGRYFNRGPSIGPRWVEIRDDSCLPITRGDVFIPPRCLTEQKGLTRHVPEFVRVTADRGIMPGIMSVAVSPVLKR